MNEKYSVTVFSSSPHPKDWGRAMATAMDQLLVLFDSDQSPDHETLCGQELRLVIAKKDDEAEITFSWSPPTR